MLLTFEKDEVRGETAVDIALKKNHELVVVVVVARVVLRGDKDIFIIVYVFFGPVAICSTFSAVSRSGLLAL